jgi:hypothetical protein
VIEIIFMLLKREYMYDMTQIHPAAFLADCYNLWQVWEALGASMIRGIYQVLSHEQGSDSLVQQHISHGMIM